MDLIRNHKGEPGQEEKNRPTLLGRDYGQIGKMQQERMRRSVNHPANLCDGITTHMQVVTPLIVGMFMSK